MARKARSRGWHHIDVDGWMHPRSKTSSMQSLAKRPEDLSSVCAVPHCLLRRESCKATRCDAVDQQITEFPFVQLVRCGFVLEETEKESIPSVRIVFVTNLQFSSNRTCSVSTTRRVHFSNALTHKSSCFCTCNSISRVCCKSARRSCERSRDGRSMARMRNCYTSPFCPARHGI
jgi:hypothetical protein